VIAGAGYAAHVEYGTHQAPAHPFLRPALDAERKASVGLIAGELRGEIEATAKRAAARAAKRKAK
jgi:hypothetical protein